MKLTILGSGTAAVAVNKRHMSGYLLEVASKKYLFDCGPGTLYQLVKKIDIMDIDNIFISHMHVDHFAGLFGLLWALQWGNFRKNAINIYGPVGFKEHIGEIFALLPGFEKFTFKINLIDVKDELIVDDLKIKVAYMKHSVDALAYRVEENDKVFVYTGDTTYNEEIAKIGKEANLLIIECSTLDEPEHMNPTQCGLAAKEANAKTLLLTHFYPIVETVDYVKMVKEEYDGKIIEAKDMMEIEI